MVSFDILCTTPESLLWWSSLHCYASSHARRDINHHCPFYHPDTAQAVARLDGEMRDVDAQRMHRWMLLFANARNNVDVSELLQCREYEKLDRVSWESRAITCMTTYIIGRRNSNAVLERMPAHVQNLFVEVDLVRVRLLPHTLALAHCSSSGAASS
jgi:hypothetical protein